MSTGCEFHGNALADLAAGRLEPARVARVRAHLAGCAACREELEVLSLVARAGAEPPPGLEARIQGAVRAAASSAGDDGAVPRRADGGRTGPWRRWAPPLAAAAVLGVLWVGVEGRNSAEGPEAALVLGAEAGHPYGAWPAAGPEIAGDPVLSDLSADDLELLLKEMRP